MLYLSEEKLPHSYCFKNLDCLFANPSDASVRLPFNDEDRDDFLKIGLDHLKYSEPDEELKKQRVSVIIDHINKCMKEVTFEDLTNMLRRSWIFLSTVFTEQHADDPFKAAEKCAEGINGISIALEKYGLNDLTENPKTQANAARFFERTKMFEKQINECFIEDELRLSRLRMIPRYLIDLYSLLDNLLQYIVRYIDGEIAFEDYIACMYRSFLEPFTVMLNHLYPGFPMNYAAINSSNDMFRKFQKMFDDYIVHQKITEEIQMSLKELRSEFAVHKHEEYLKFSRYIDNKLADLFVSDSHQNSNKEQFATWEFVDTEEKNVSGSIRWVLDGLMSFGLICSDFERKLSRIDEMLRYKDKFHAEELMRKLIDCWCSKQVDLLIVMEPWSENIRTFYLNSVSQDFDPDEWS